MARKKNISARTKRLKNQYQYNSKKMTLKAKDAKNIRHLKNMKSEKLNVIGRPLIK